MLKKVLFCLLFLPSLAMAQCTFDSCQIGKLYGAPTTSFFNASSASDITNTSSTAVKAAGGAGVRYYVTSWSCSNTSGVATRIDLLDGSTVIYSSMLPAGGGFHASFQVPLRGSANTALNAQAATTATATRCSLSGFSGTD